MLTSPMTWQKLVLTCTRPLTVPKTPSINTLTWIVCVRLCVTDVTSLPQRVLWERGYKVSLTRTLGTSLLNVAMADMVIFIAP